MSSTTFGKTFEQLGNGVRELARRVTQLEKQGGGGGSVNGEDTVSPGDLTPVLYDALENGRRGSIKLTPGAEYHISETTPVPPKSILEGQGSRIIAEENTPLIRPWPTAQVRDLTLDWHGSDSFDSEGILFLHDDALYDPSIPKPWDRDTPGPVRAWAHARAGSVYHELDDISIDGNRKGKAVSVRCEASANGGIHFVNGTGIQVERVDTAIHLYRDKDAFQVNSQMFDVHVEDCRVGVHHEHDPREESDKRDPPRGVERSHMNGNKYLLSWQPDGSQGFSESLWILEEGKNNWMVEQPFFWDLSSRHDEDDDHFIFESAYPEMPDYRRNINNTVVSRHNLAYLFRDEVRNLNKDHRRNKAVGLRDLGRVAE